MSHIIEIKNGIAIFTIDRPERMNAVNDAVMDGLAEFLDQVEDNLDVAYTVITGAGNRAFCAGGDLSEFHSMRTADEALPMLSKMSGLLYRLATLPMPTIALVNGIAVGGGCEIATACDYRVISDQANAGFIQATLAITTGWGGATLLFEKHGKHDRVFRFLSEAEVHTAEKLLEVEWATEIYDGTAEQGLERFLSKMSRIHPSVHRAYKTIAIRKWTADFMRDRMLEESRQCARLWEQEAHHEVVERFLSKRS
ncbi:enoyl-CoA hydratase/isomerase family protein [Sporosarcina limicola]|uniref:Ethylmalonyl-CoA decarboxylase n=1 Tax=Sporosarcina limicola TaxID=34101 RepID=A0A927MFM0_9BACL|nr:enoyl-CoA hydratase/isomerase family protein [Sporosarcina limicola]MBE1553570.1 enoyl-CoA hydratase/carnithine racemase [Sporosarcina limicola]